MSICNESLVLWIAYAISIQTSNSNIKRAHQCVCQRSQCHVQYASSLNFFNWFLETETLGWNYIEKKKRLTNPFLQNTKREEKERGNLKKLQSCHGNQIPGPATWLFKPFRVQGINWYAGLRTWSGRIVSEPAPTAAPESTCELSQALFLAVLLFSSHSFNSIFRYFLQDRFHKALCSLGKYWNGT